MKKILHFLIISFFSFNIISCDTTTIMLGAVGGGAAYWYKDDISTWYDDFSKETDNTGSIFGIKETTLSFNDVTFGNGYFVAVGNDEIIYRSTDGDTWTKVYP